MPRIFSISETKLSPIRSQGPGGQNVNKVSTAIQLSFDVGKSSLSASQKQQILAKKDRRINKKAVIIIKAQRFRTQEKNRTDALNRLNLLIESALKPLKIRRETKPSKALKTRWKTIKTQRSELKLNRKKVRF